MSATHRMVYNAVQLVIAGAMRDVDHGLAPCDNDERVTEKAVDLYDVLDAVAQCLGDWAENLDAAEQLDIAQRVTNRATQYIP